MKSRRPSTRSSAYDNFDDNEMASGVKQRFSKMKMTMNQDSDGLSIEEARKSLQSPSTSSIGSMKSRRPSARSSAYENFDDNEMASGVKQRLSKMKITVNQDSDVLRIRESRRSLDSPRASSIGSMKSRQSSSRSSAADNIDDYEMASGVKQRLSKMKMTTNQDSDVLRIREARRSLPESPMKSRRSSSPMKSRRSSPESVLGSLKPGSLKPSSSAAYNSPAARSASQANRTPHSSYTSTTSSSSLKKSASKKRTAVAERRANYSMAVDKHFEKKVTHIQLLRGKRVAIKDLNNLRKYFDEIDEDHSGTLEASEIMKVVEEAQHYRELRAHGKIADEEWTRLQMRYQSVGILTNQGSTPAGPFTHLLKYMDADNNGSISWSNILQMMYPLATNEEITQLSLIHTPTESKALSMLSHEALKDLEDLWNLFDDDGNGELDQEEFTRALLLLHIEKQDINDIYFQIDMDKSNGISKAEFAAWWFTDQSIDEEQRLDLNDNGLPKIPPVPAPKLTKVERSTLKDMLWREHMKRLGLSHKPRYAMV